MASECSCRRAFLSNNLAFSFTTFNWKLGRCYVFPACKFLYAFEIDDFCIQKWFTVSFLHSFAWQVNYGNFMHGLMKENIQLNRKVLSEISMHEPYSFKALVDVSRNAFPGNKTAIIPPKKEGLAILVWMSSFCWDNDPLLVLSCDM